MSRRLPAVVGLLLAVAAGPAGAASNAGAEEQLTVEQVVGLVDTHCGGCHGVPSPGLMPKKSWPGVIRAMAALAAKRTGQEFVSAEVIRHITAYYYGSSPESLPVLPYADGPSASRTFAPSELGGKSIMPLVINVRPVVLTDEGGSEFLICDGESNTVRLLTRSDGTWQETVLAEVAAPSHTDVVDYDKDGDKDIIVAALGVLPPSAEPAGKVFVLRQSAGGRFEQELLLDGVGRITDARAVDIDNDDDLDLAVAVFGGGAVGEVAWLENLGGGKHAKHVLLNLSGALNVSPVDLNSDGRVDFVSLIAQEHEMVIAFINKGQGEFDQLVLGRGPHPMYGSTGMSMTDLDGDGDADVLFTNGDVFDTQSDPKPYHGVQWLENQGDLQFRFHDIGRYYGAATAMAADMDGDGDLDVVAGSWANYWQDERRRSLIWFENDGKQNFTRHGILGRPPGIVSLALDDVNGDGQLDVLAGVFRMDLLVDRLKNPAGNHSTAGAEPQPLAARLVLLENRTAIDRLPE